VHLVRDAGHLRLAEDEIVTNPVVIRDGCIDLDELADISIDEKRLAHFAE
jgi:hypothetical protein